MIVVGARFRALAGARAALRAIRASVGVPDGDVAVRPLGGTRYESPIDDFVLAGRFEDGDVAAVINAVHAHGGRVIERRSDTPRPLAPAAPTPGVTGRIHHDARRAGGDTRRELRKRLRRPSPPRRVRATLRHRISD